MERLKIARAQLTGLSDLETKCEWRSSAEGPLTFQAPSSSAKRKTVDVGANEA